jgi:ParB family chromosome partitioning protein
MTTRPHRIDPHALRAVTTGADGAILTADVEPDASGQHQRIIDYPIERIEIGSRLRHVSDDVSDLARSMEKLGQLQPVVLTRDGKLVAGAHRVAAAKLLGWRTVRAIVRHFDSLDAELAEIDENLRRNELTVLEQADHLQRREQILIERGQRAGAPAPADDEGAARGETVSPPQTTADMAGAMGISERSAQQRLQIARNLDPTVKRRIAGTPLANSTTQLLELARLPHREQNVALSFVDLGTAPTVRHAAALLALKSGARGVLQNGPWAHNLPALLELGKIEDGIRQRAVADLLISGKAITVPQALDQLRPAAATYYSPPPAGGETVSPLPEPEETASVVPSSAAHTRQQGAPLGKCTICNRPLTDPVQAAKGIGACCAAKAAAGATSNSQDPKPAGAALVWQASPKTYGGQFLTDVITDYVRQSSGSEDAGVWATTLEQINPLTLFSELGAFCQTNASDVASARLLLLAEWAQSAAAQRTGERSMYVSKSLHPLDREQELRVYVAKFQTLLGEREHLDGSLDRWGSLTGRHTETLACSRELRKLLTITQQELALLEDEGEEEEEA